MDGNPVIEVKEVDSKPAEEGSQKGLHRGFTKDGLEIFGVPVPQVRASGKKTPGKYLKLTDDTAVNLVKRRTEAVTSRKVGPVPDRQDTDLITEDSQDFGNVLTSVQGTQHSRHS